MFEINCPVCSKPIIHVEFKGDVTLSRRLAEFLAKERLLFNGCYCDVCLDTEYRKEADVA